MTLLFLSLWALLAIFPLVTDAAFLLSLAHKQEQCFVLRTPKGPEKSLITGSFDFLDDKYSPEGLSVVILNDHMDIIYQSPYDARSGTIQATGLGRLYVCVRHGIDRQARSSNKNIRRVGLDVQVKVADSSNDLSSLVQNVQSAVWNFKIHHDYMREREAEHRVMAETTFSRLLFWALTEATCVILAGVAQIVVMRRFFDEKRRRLM
jgi:hypothetical protein